MTDIARAIFLVPPFPGATPHDIVRAMAAGEQPPRPGPSAHALIAAMRQHKVGGPFWLPGDETGAVLHLEADDPQALLAAIAGRRVEISGAGLFAALHDAPADAPETAARLEALVARHLIDGIAYHDPFTGARTGPLEIVEIFAAWRALIAANRPIMAAFGFAHWKRDTVDPLLWGGAPVPFRSANEGALADLPHDATIAVWKARVLPAFLARLEQGPWTLLEVEDGFIRSAGLGADCVPPLSIVVDDLGVHYDPARPNRLEARLSAGHFPPRELERARALRHWLVREGVSKYGVGAVAALLRPQAATDANKRVILVVGQVEDDRSMLFGAGAVRSNLELLRRVRALAPDAYLIYRPHPDVEAGHRRGAISPQAASELADAIDGGSPISALIAMVDDVHVITSLAGFEALLHGKPVTTHGTPFFAGWGLTTDRGAGTPRRSVSRTLDELVAGVLLEYPRYLDPVTNLPCTAEGLVLRLLSGVRRRNRALVPARRFFGWMKRAAKQLLGMR